MVLRFIRALTDPNPAGEFYGDMRVFGGGKGGQKAPSAAKQAAAQSTADKETSWYNALLQNMDQITPYGNLTYEQSGTKSAPKWTSTINLSPEQQQIFASQNRQDIAMNQLGEQQIGRIGDAVASPFSYGGIKNALPTADDIMGQQMRSEEAFMSRLNPQFAQDEEALRTRLINQGIGQGSQAYQREMDTFNQARNDARSQAVLAGQQYGGTAQNQALDRRLQEINEYSTQRNAPLNEYIGLTSGTQIVNPQFSSGGNQGINSFDMAGAMRDQYSNQQAASNNRSSAMSSAFGLGGQALGTALGVGSLAAGTAGAGAAGGFLGSGLGSLFALSDERLKTDIELVREENGHKIYHFKYKTNPDKVYEGVMAQDVLEYKPEAVHKVGEYYAVNYPMLGLEMKEVA
jgi:hypothetical protein